MAAALKAAIASANRYDITIRHCLETTVMRVHLSMTWRRCGRPCRRSSLRSAAADDVFSRNPRQAHQWQGVGQVWGEGEAGQKGRSGVPPLYRQGKGWSASRVAGISAGGAWKGTDWSTWLPSGGLKPWMLMPPLSSWGNEIEILSGTFATLGLGGHVRPAQCLLWIHGRDPPWRTRSCTTTGMLTLRWSCRRIRCQMETCWSSCLSQSTWRKCPFSICGLSSSRCGSTRVRERLW